MEWRIVRNLIDLLPNNDIYVYDIPFTCYISSFVYIVPEGYLFIGISINLSIIPSSFSPVEFLKVSFAMADQAPVRNWSFHIWYVDGDMPCLRQISVIAWFVDMDSNIMLYFSSTVYVLPAINYLWLNLCPYILKIYYYIWYNI